MQHPQSATWTAAGGVFIVNQQQHLGETTVAAAGWIVEWSHFGLLGL
jgi:hypothetical protein